MSNTRLDSGKAAVLMPHNALLARTSSVKLGEVFARALKALDHLVK